MALKTAFQALHGLWNGFGWFHVITRVGDHAAFVDEKGRAYDPCELLAEYLLLAPGAVGLRHSVLHVACKRKAEVVFLVGLLLLLRAIGADAEHVDVKRRKVGLCVVDAAGLGRAPSLPAFG